MSWSALMPNWMRNEVTGMAKLLNVDWAPVHVQMSIHVYLTTALGRLAPLNGSVAFSPYSALDGVRVWLGFKRISSDQAGVMQG